MTADRQEAQSGRDSHEQTPAGQHGEGPPDALLFRRLRAEGDQRAREQLIERYLPLARRLARRYQRTDEPMDDLVQVASLGLIKAVDRFDTDRDVLFSSYAVPTILGELKRHFRDRTWSVRVPRDLQELALRIDQAVTALSAGSGRVPAIWEVAQAVDATEERVLDAMEAAGTQARSTLPAARAKTTTQARLSLTRLAPPRAASTAPRTGRSSSRCSRMSLRESGWCCGCASPKG
jgi:RNA polymerase sigma-B factor